MRNGGAWLGVRSKTRQSGCKGRGSFRIAAEFCATRSESYAKTHATRRFSRISRAFCKSSERKNRALSSIPLRLSCELPATPGLCGPIGNRRGKPPRCKKRMHLRRSQTERKIANLRGFNPFFHAHGQLRFVWPEPFVPVSQNRKHRQHERNPDRGT